MIVATAGITGLVSNVAADVDEPLQAELVAVNISSANSGIANTMPEGSTWTVTLTDGTFVDSGVFTDRDLSLPASGWLDSPVPYGEYLISINALPAFAAYEHVHVINMPEQLVEIVLVPTEQAPEPELSTVTMTFTSDDPEAANVLPEGSTWTITRPSGDPLMVDQGVFSVDQLELPVTISLNASIPYGEYLVSISGPSVFRAYEHVHTANAPEQVWDIVLTPKPDQEYADVLMNVSSAQPELGYTLPEGSTWTITRTSGEPLLVAEGTFDQLELPVTIPVSGVPYDEYLFSINGLPVFQAYEHVHNVLVPEAWVEIVLNPAAIPDDGGDNPDVDDGQAEETGDDTDGTGKDANGKKDGTSENTTGKVTSLPTTGHGDVSSGTSSLMLMSAVASLLAVTGALALRSKRA